VVTAQSTKMVMDPGLAQLASIPVHPVELKVAPGDLQVLQSFVNTRVLLHRRDELDSPSALRTWLVSSGLMRRGDTVTEADLQWAVEVREALRALLLSKQLGEVDPIAVGTINRAADRSRLQLRFDHRGTSEPTVAAAGVDGAIGRILASAFVADPEAWDRLKVCRNPACRLAFYDRSKNRSGTWCTMAECGNLMKGRAYRRRQRDQAKAITANPAAGTRSRPGPG
jgi:predicted RNA-binding Zn ribbon-like protein